MDYSNDNPARGSSVQAQTTQGTIPPNNDTPQLDSQGQGQESGLGVDQSNTQEVAKVRRRKRITRACEICRRKKTKCDGANPCSLCRSSNIECVYRDAAEALTSTHLQDFDGRLKSLEDLVTRAFKSFEAQSQLLRGPSASSIHQTVEGSTPFSRPATEAPVATVGGPSPESMQELQSAVLSRVDFLRTGLENLTREAGHKPLSTAYAIHRASRKRKRGAQDLEPEESYADAYGEMHVDEHGQPRYIGIGSTLSVIDICSAFRSRINRGLQLKGYDDYTTFLTALPSSVKALPAEGMSPGYLLLNDTLAHHLPPVSLVSVMMGLYFERLHFIFPVISQNDAHTQLMRLMSSAPEDRDTDFFSVLYSLLAFVSPLLEQNHHIFENEEVAPYKERDLGALFFGLSTACRNSTSTTQSCAYRDSSHPRRSLNAVISLAFQSAYLAQICSHAEAWIFIGQAARLGQDLGLHRSASMLGMPKAEQERRRYAWWCVYSLDRTLSACLGRPNAIHDDDCDVEIPRPEQGDKLGATHDCTGFVAIINLRQLLGKIQTTVTSVRNAQAARHIDKIQVIRDTVTELKSRLHAWATSEVPTRIKSASSGKHGAEKSIALSGYFAATMLLFRFFLSNPHRPSFMKNAEALSQCAWAATNCIRLTENFIASVPICPDLIFHAQHVFTGSLLLLHCVRRSEDLNFIREALGNVETALSFLTKMEPLWPGAYRCRGIVEEYVEFTLEFLEKDKHHGKCAFHHETGELTGLEPHEEPGRPSLKSMRVQSTSTSNDSGSDTNKPSNVKSPTGAGSDNDDMMQVVQIGNGAGNGGPGRPNTSTANSTGMGNTGDNNGAGVGNDGQAMQGYRYVQSNYPYPRTEVSRMPPPPPTNQIFLGGEVTQSWGIDGSDGLFDSLLGIDCCSEISGISPVHVDEDSVIWENT